MSYTAALRRACLRVDESSGFLCVAKCTIDFGFNLSLHRERKVSSFRSLLLVEQNNISSDELAGETCGFSISGCCPSLVFLVLTLKRTDPTLR